MMKFIYLNISVLFFILFILNMVFMMNFLMMNKKMLVEFNLLEMNSMNFSVSLFYDYKSFMFMGVVLLISSMIVLYSVEYMMLDNFSIRFVYILMLFVLSMLMMIMGQNLLMILLGWDGLGLISYCLVIYYNNWNSYNSGMITILTNRLGDCGLLISIGIFGMMGDWNFMCLYMTDYLMMFMLLMACLTKSAQVPFSSWLPMAMAAPTPISALVHSSTLVTAGVYFLIRLDLMVIFDFMLIKKIIYLSIMTMFFSGVVAMFENDFKKIIALSTLSQLGLMMLGVLMKLFNFSFFHLITHAMFKSLLFMCAGLILHSMMGNQDLRFMGSLEFYFPFTLIMFNCANLALWGFPFMAGFYSKDLILEGLNYFSCNFFMMMMFYMSLLLTILYSMRLMYYMIYLNFNFFLMSSLSDLKLMNYSMLIMFLMSILSGSLLSWLMFSNLNLFFLLKEVKIFIIYLFIFSYFLQLLMFLDKYKYMEGFILYFKFFKNMWMMNYFSNFLIKNFLTLSSGYYLELDKGMWEKMLDYGNYLYFLMMNMEKFIKIIFMNFMFLVMMLIFYLII